MATTNRERQQHYRKAKNRSGDSRVSCWLDKDDKQRLSRLMALMNGTSQGRAGYAEVISRALKEMEINLTPAGGRNVVRYGLLFMDKTPK
jgi:hypothetical protein